MNEQSKAAERRKLDTRFTNRWIVGRVLDVGCGNDPISSKDYPRIREIVPYDTILGSIDGMYLPEHEKGTFDTVHASHCLEHLGDPRIALTNWLRVLRPGGYIVCMVPDELLYEGGVWPSRWNKGHLHSFTNRFVPVIGSSINLQSLLYRIPAEMELLHLITQHWDIMKAGEDQTLGKAECAIEFVVRAIAPNYAARE